MLFRGISKMNQWVNALADNLSFTLKVHMVKRKNWFRKFSFHLYTHWVAGIAHPTTKYKNRKENKQKIQTAGCGGTGL